MVHIKASLEIIVSWEPEGCHQYSKMFHWEPEGHCHCTMYIWQQRPSGSQHNTLNSNSTLVALKLHYVIFFFLGQDHFSLGAFLFISAHVHWASNETYLCPNMNNFEGSGFQWMSLWRSDKPFFWRSVYMGIGRKGTHIFFERGIEANQRGHLKALFNNVAL